MAEEISFNIKGSVDEPCENDISYYRISIRGWAIPPYKIDHIEVIINDEYKVSIQIGNEPRPDVAIAYPHIYGAELGGYNGTVMLGEKEGTYNLVINAVDIYGNSHEIGRRKVINSRSAINKGPEWFHIGLITKCNLSCDMCPAHSHSSNFLSNGGIIDKELLDYALENLKDFSQDLKYIQLTDWGEPFLYNDIFNVIDRVSEICPDATTLLNTNGTLLTDNIIEKIIDSNLKDLSISIDAGTKNTYEKIRKGANFEKVISNVKKLVEQRNRKGKKYPIIKTSFVILKSNVHELPFFVNLSKEIGVDRISTKNPIGLFESDNKEALYCMPCETSRITSRELQYIIEARHIAKNASIPMHIPSFKPTDPGLDCVTKGRNHPFLVITGDIYPCCVLSAEGCEKGTHIKSMGNIRNQTLKQIWESDQYMKFREAFFKGDLPHPFCKQCPRYYNM